MTDPVQRLDPPKRVLLVDDKPENLHLLVQILHAHNYIVNPTINGKTALRFLESKHVLPDIILLDIDMPGMNGYELCSRLKANPHTRDIPVIFISVGDQIVDKAKAFAQGGVDYITKPFQEKEVLMRVRAHLAIRERQKDLEQRVQARTGEVAAVKARLDEEIALREQAQRRVANLESVANQSMIMESKLDPPQVSDHFFSIARIEAQFEHACRRRITTIEAPAGYGKSTTMAKLRTQVASKNIPVAWINLDTEDNDPHRFMQYVTAAFHRAFDNPHAGSSLAIDVRPTSVVGDALHALCTNLGRIGEEVVLFLDDFHLIENRTVHDAMNWLIKYCPRNVRFVVATRTQLPLKLGKLRLAGDTCDLHATDLILRLDEVESFIVEVSGQILSAAQLRRLYDSTEGWPTGLHVAALALKGGASVAEFVDGYSGRDKDITAYVGEVVLSHLPAREMEFLNFATLFDRFSVDLSRDIFSRDEAVALVETIRAKNLFLISLDRENQWYRFHHMFADYVRGSYLQQHPDDAKAIYNKASIWFEQHNLTREAIRYALAGDDYLRGSDLVARNVHALVRQRGEHGVMLDWISLLPRSYVDDRPSIRLANAWSLMFTHRFAQAESEILALETHIEQLDQMDLVAAPTAQAHKSTKKMIQFMRCVFYFLTDRTALAAPLCVQWLSELDDSALCDVAVARNVLGYCQYKAGDYVSASHSLQAAKEGFATIQSPYGVAWSQSTAAIALIERGEMSEADTVLTQAYHSVSQSLGAHSHGAVMLALLRARVCYDQDRLDEAVEVIDDVFACATGHGLIETIFSAYRTKARLLAAAGQFEQADQCLTDGISIAKHEALPRLTLLLEVERALLYLRDGRIERASSAMAIIHAMSSSDREEGADADRAVQILDIRVKLATHSLLPIDAALDLLLAEARGQECHLLIVKLLCLKATSHVRRGNRSKSLLLLDEALAIGESRRLVRVFEDESKDVADLIGELVMRRISQEQNIEKSTVKYLHQVVNVLAYHFGKEKADLPTPASLQTLPDEFSNRELQILSLLADGLGNRDLATRLFLSEATVKWHLQNIYSKLDVNSRSKAIIEARKLFLI